METCTLRFPGSLGHRETLPAWKLNRKRQSTGGESKDCFRKKFKKNGELLEYVNTVRATSLNPGLSPPRRLSSITSGARTIEPKENLVLESDAGDQTVTYVNNLFSPVNKLQAIPLGLDELRRRTEYPEYFGRSEMVAYLRHSKTTGNELISKYDLKPRSKRSCVNVLSRLCEREARILANGIHKINSEYFPTDYVAEKMKEEMTRGKLSVEAGRDERKGEEKDETKERNDGKETIETTIGMLQSLKQFVQAPDEELSKDLEVFERATHTFGCQNIVNHITFVENYLTELQKKL